MATHLKIFILTCLLSPMVFMEEVKPVMLEERGGLKQRTKRLEDSMRELKERMEALEECKACSKIQELNETLSELQEKSNPKPAAVQKDCAELYKSGNQNSGVYTINPDGSDTFDVFCDQTTAGGGWTVFQKRQGGSVDFYRGWADYKGGFGNLNGEYWLGLEKIHRLTSSGQYKLRVDLEDFAGNTVYAEYDTFGVASEGNKYQLSVGSYSGTAGDSLAYHNGYPFTTKDQDNDSFKTNCALQFKGAWWYVSCYHSNLNGPYRGKYTGRDSVTWYLWKQNYESAKRAEMKIRPVNF